MPGEVALKVFGAVIADVHEARAAGAVDDDQAGEFGKGELLDGIPAVHCHGQRISGLLQEGPGPFRGLAVLLHIDGPEDDVGVVLVVPVEALEFRHLATAGRTPGGPIIEHDDMAAPVDGTYEAAVGPAEFEGGRWSNCGAGRHSSRKRGEGDQGYDGERRQRRQSH